MCMTLARVFFLATGFLFYSANGFAGYNVTSSSWDGVVFYISVQREAVQKKLDVFHSSSSSECGNGPKLYLPEREVFPDLDGDQHPVYIEVGNLTSHDFDDYLADNPHPRISLYGWEVGVTIPFLSGTSGGPPVYALALAKFFEKSRCDIPKTDLLYPYFPVDEITMSNNSAVVRNGTDEMKVSFSRLVNHTCKPPSKLVRNEFYDFTRYEFHVGLPEPDFSFCDRHSFESEFCTNAARVRCGAHRNAPNVCQIWESANEKTCKATVEIQNMTSGFRNFFLLGDEPINVSASEALSGDYVIGLKYPCQE